MSERRGEGDQRSVSAFRRTRRGARPAASSERTEERSDTPTGAELAGCVLAVARKSDHHAFAALFSHFAPRLKTYFLRSGMTDADAEELAQETMVLVWRKADRFDPDKAAASTWIFAIGRNVRVDALRRGRHAASAAPPCGTADDSQEPPEQCAETLVASAQHEQRLRQALRGLPPEQAEVLRLSYLGDRSHAEVGHALGIPLGTVKGRIRQALARLRAALGGERP